MARKKTVRPPKRSYARRCVSDLQSSLTVQLETIAIAATMKRPQDPIWLLPALRDAAYLLVAIKAIEHVLEWERPVGMAPEDQED